jgi:hypothetical protein
MSVAPEKRCVAAAQSVDERLIMSQTHHPPLRPRRRDPFRGNASGRVAL